MKKNLFVVAAVALMAFTACNKEEFNYGAGAPVGSIEFTAGFEAETKTTLADGKTVWVKGDEISINGLKFVAQNDGASATFINDEVPTEPFKAPYVAIYPYTSGGKVPSTQGAYVDNFDPKAVIEIAESDNHELSFKNVTSLLKFQVPTNCETVTLTSDTELAGIEGAYEKEVNVIGKFTVNTDYYVAVLPGEKKNFTVKVDDYVVKSAESVTINSSAIIPMTLPYNVYLHAQTGRYDWTNDGAYFAAWTWKGNGSGKWTNLIPEGHTGVYRLEVTADDDKLILVRKANAENKEDWSNVWNQTANLDMPNDEKCHFYIKESTQGDWGAASYVVPAKIAFELNTDNAKTWWGDTSYLYLEIDGEAQLEAWPGRKMNKVDTYKWECEIPGTLVGKKVYCQVHQNNKWIGKKDITFTYVYTIYGSEIGIN